MLMIFYTIFSEQNIININFWTAHMKKALQLMDEKINGEWFFNSIFDKPSIVEGQASVRSKSLEERPE